MMKEVNSESVKTCWVDRVGNMLHLSKPMKEEFLYIIYDIISDFEGLVHTFQRPNLQFLTINPSPLTLKMQT